MNASVQNKDGRIITFYSFKGGSGRSMALANTAVLLARPGVGAQGKTVLMMDWDLEAPGLHEFFKEYIPENEVNEKRGVIDLFLSVEQQFPSGIYSNDDLDQASTLIREFFKDAAIRLNFSEDIYLLKAGRFDEGYALSVQTFDWRSFFDRCNLFLTLLIRYLNENYHFTLIDSRTGLTDMGGICTSVLPEVFVAVFTPTRQGLRVTEVAEKAVNYRKGANDLRPLVVYPLASRIDTSAEGLNHLWKQNYTEQFEEVFQRMYNLEICDLKPYFGKVEVHHVANYSYGESIAVLDNGSMINKHELPAKYNELVQLIIGEYFPWEMPDLPEPRLVSATDYFNFANLLVKNKEFKRAERYFQRAIALEPSGSKGYDAFLEYLENRQEWERMEVVYDDWLESLRESNEDTYWTTLAVFLSFLVKRKRLKKAKTLAELYIKVDSSKVPIQLSYATILAQLEALNEAESVYQAILNEQPDNTSVLNAYAVFLMDNKKNYPAAEDIFKKLAQFESDQGAYGIIIAQLLLYQGKKEEAEAYIEGLLLIEDMTDFGKCLLWLLRLVYFPDLFNDASTKISAFIDEGVSFPLKDFSADLKIAVQNNHPYITEVEYFIKKITSEDA